MLEINHQAFLDMARRIMRKYRSNHFTEDQLMDCLVTLLYFQEEPSGKLDREILNHYRYAWGVRGKEMLDFVAGSDVS